jgi:hypothetical protein
MKIATLKSVLGPCLVCILINGAALPAHGQSAPGVSEGEILIASCSALEGPSHFLGVETVTGAKAYFNLINDEGGVDGRKLKLISADDSYDPAKTQACFDHLMSEKVFALGFFVGTQGLIHTIESIHDQDLGLGPQLKLNYFTKEHKGFDHVLPTVVRGGRAVPFTDWSTAAPQ